MSDYCVYKQVYKNGASVIKYGKIINSYKPVLEFDPENMEVHYLHKPVSQGDARKLWERLVNNTPVLVEGSFGYRIYRSIEDASTATGVHPRNILGCMENRPGYRSPRGFHFMRYPKECADETVFRDPKIDRAALPLEHLGSGKGRRIRVYKDPVG